jgi:CTP-dependent riboflavin kinase
MGGRKPVVKDYEILSAFVQSSDPVLSSAEVSESISITENGTYKRLVELQDECYVNSKKIARGRAWWITEKGRDYVQNENAPEA